MWRYHKNSLVTMHVATTTTTHIHHVICLINICSLDPNIMLINHLLNLCMVNLTDCIFYRKDISNKRLHAYKTHNYITTHFVEQWWLTNLLKLWRHNNLTRHVSIVKNWLSIKKFIIFVGQIPPMPPILPPMLYS